MDSEEGFPEKWFSAKFFQNGFLFGLGLKLFNADQWWLVFNHCTYTLHSFMKILNFAFFTAKTASIKANERRKQI